MQAHNNLGVAYASLGKYPESITEYQEALKIAADYPPAQHNLGYAQAHTSLGISYFRQGQYDKALAEYKQALAIDPECADAYYNLGLFYHQKMDLRESVYYYQLAIKFDPKNVKALNNLGKRLSSIRQRRRSRCSISSGTFTKTKF